MIPGSDTTEFVLPIPSLSDNKKKPWAAVSYIYQELWNGGKGDPRKVYAFLGGSIADKNPSFARWNTFASIEAMGPLPMRPDDRAGISGWYTAVNEDLKDLLGSLPVPIDVGDSWGLEFYYNLAINRWLHITGDLQLVQNARKRRRHSRRPRCSIRNRLLAMGHRGTSREPLRAPVRSPC